MAVLLLVAFAIAQSTGVDFAALVSDTNAANDAPYYVGAISTLGIMLWTAAGTAALLTAAVAETAERQLRRLLLVLGSVSLWLALDDLLMIHEGRIRDLVGVHEKPVYLAYGLVIAGLLAAQHRVVLTRTAWPVLGVAVALLGASIAYDALFEGSPFTVPFSRSVAYLIEEGAKQLGIAVWLAYVLGLSRQVLRTTGDSRREPAEDRQHAAGVAA